MSSLGIRSAAIALSALMLSIAGSVRGETTADLVQQVRDTENAFATTMAKRDLKAFASYIADDAIFFGKEGPLRGKAAVVDGWKGLYDGANPPFSWSSETVEVLDSGTLAHSSGPVFSPDGRRVGMFISIWRRGANGEWKIVFDKGCEACACAQEKK